MIKKEIKRDGEQSKNLNTIVSPASVNRENGGERNP